MKQWKYMVPFAATFILLVIFEIYKPKPLDWTKSLSRKEKIPYATYILYQMLPDLFPGKNIKTSGESFYETLPNMPGTSNLLMISADFDPARADLNSLLNYIDKGNSGFIASENFGKALLDTLKLSQDKDFNLYTPKNDTSLAAMAEDSTYLTLENSNGHSRYYFKKSAVSDYFDQYDSLQTIILGRSEKGNPNLIKISFGKGYLILCSTPLAFSNYYLLRGNTPVYVSKTLSMLPNQQTWWDDYYQFELQKKTRTPLRFILKQESLRWALFICLGSLLLFILFEARRKQRLIPVPEKIINYNLEFTKTLSQLYFYHQDHKNMAMKKISYFLDHVRQIYLIKTDVTDEQFTSLLAAKSGHSTVLVHNLVSLINDIKMQPEIGAYSLEMLNYLIDEFNAKRNI